MGLRFLKVDNYTMHVGIKMRLGVCEAFSQSTDTDRRGVGRSYSPGSIMRGADCLT